MFGYVYPDKPELKIKEFSAYKTVYCSLCSELRTFGFGAKAFLNYDFVFAAMLEMSLSDTKYHGKAVRCNTNPLEKVTELSSNPALHNAAAALIISSRYKLLDNLKDENFLKSFASRVIMLFTNKAYNQAKSEYSQLDAFIAGCMNEQAAFENSGLDSIDRACDATAKGLALIFSCMSTCESQKKILSKFGYFIGRFVYLADSGDDLKEDIKKSRYNPIALRYKLSKKSSDESVNVALEEVKSQIKMTVGQIEECYKELQPTAYRSILDNIIYLGLYKTCCSIGEKKKGTK